MPGRPSGVRRWRTTTATLAAATLLAVGCAQQSGPADVEEQPGATMTESQDPPTTSPDTSPSEADASPRVRVVGTVTSVGRPCVELVDEDGTSWALVGEGVTRLRRGVRLEVTGRRMPDVVALCPGAPLRVLEMTVLE